MIASFKFYVMNFVDSVTNHYIHITSHVTQIFASCTHYTSYYLLNIVHVIVCVFQSDQPSLKLLWVLFVKNIFMCLSFFFKGEWLKILILGKLGFKTCVLEKHFISYSCIFISYLQCFEVCLQKSGYFLNRCFSGFLIDPICSLINRNLF